jgi:hypothetical protein
MRAILGGLGKIPRPTPAILVALVALLIAASGAAVAAIPSSDGTITACRDIKTGALRVIDAPSQSCVNSKETLLPWKDGIHGTVANSDNSDKLDNKDSTDFYAAGSKVADSAHADQADTAASAGDADTLDGKDSTQFANATHAHSGADITSGTVEADRIEDGSGSNLDADTLDGLDSTEFGAAASAVKVERLELPVPDIFPGREQPPNSETIFETNAFEIRGVCNSFRLLSSVDVAEAKLLLVAKEGGALVVVTREGGNTESINLQPGESAPLGSLQTTSLSGGGDPHTYNSYLAETHPSSPFPGGFLHGQATMSIGRAFERSEGEDCTFNVSGLGQ